MMADMSYPIFTVDAFASAPFEGNPAAVCFPDRDVDDAWLANVASEMALSETAFLWPAGDNWDLRWLTPKVEVDLCGHATLAAAHVLLETERARGEIRFNTRSGRLTATPTGCHIELDFPATTPEPCEAPIGLFDALGCQGATLRSRFDVLVVLEAESEVRAVEPDFRALGDIDARGVMVTAPGNEFDFVSRFFAPGAGVDEDPVTGSAHCALTPYWARRLSKTSMQARQLSQRGGSLEVELVGDRVKLRGSAITMTRGELIA